MFVSLKEVESDEGAVSKGDVDDGSRCWRRTAQSDCLNRGMCDDSRIFRELEGEEGISRCGAATPLESKRKSFC